MTRIEEALGSLVAWNNRQVHRRAVDRSLPNPRPLDGVAWNDRLEAAHPTIRAEWDRFRSAGGGLPPIEELIAEHQGNEGVWRAGLLISSGKPATRLAAHFPETLRALQQVPGIRSALFSVLEPGAELPEHSGPNAGVARYHLGIDCGDGAALVVGDRTVAYRDGRGVLFDDTASHAAWNRGAAARTTLLCEIVRPVPGVFGVVNRAVQRLLGLDPRYRHAPRRADEHLRHARVAGPAGR